MVLKEQKRAAAAGKLSPKTVVAFIAPGAVERRESVHDASVARGGVDVRGR
jgi:hypothetical protein